MYVCMYVCMFVYMHVYANMYVFICMYIIPFFFHIMYVRMYVYTYVCVALPRAAVRFSPGPLRGVLPTGAGPGRRPCPAESACAVCGPGRAACCLQRTRMG